MAEQPTPEEFEAHLKVSKWFNQQRHRFELAAGRYEMHFSDEGVSVSTAHGEEMMTDELWVQLGWTRTDEGWTNG